MGYAAGKKLLPILRPKDLKELLENHTIDEVCEILNIGYPALNDMMNSHRSIREKKDEILERLRASVYYHHCDLNENINYEERFDGFKTYYNPIEIETVGKIIHPCAEFLK